MTITMRDRAIHLAQQGFSVFPLAVGTKDVPVTPPGMVVEKGRYFDQVPSNDPHKVATMWSDNAGGPVGYNIGICTNDLLVVDLDMKGGKNGLASWPPLARELGLEEITVAVRTPSGGQHRFYKLPGTERARNTVEELGAGVDTRGWHGYVVAPGSRVPEGEYEWLLPPADTTIAVASEQAIVRVGQGSTARREHDVVPGLDTDHPDDVERAINWLVNHAPHAIEKAGGDNATFNVACRVRAFGVEEDTCLQLLLDHWNPVKAEPPWQPDELQVKVSNAYQYAQEPAGTRSLKANLGPVPLEETTAEAKVYGLPIWRYDPAEKPTPKGWLIKGIAARGETAGWIGPPGSGKSALVLDWFAHGATGRDWRGHKCKEKTAFVYFAFERALLTKRRITAYAQQWGLKDIPVAVVSEVLNLMDPRTMGVVWDTIKRAEDMFGMPVGGITFDTYPKGIAAGGGEENSAKDVNRAAANIRTLQEKLNQSLHVALIGHTGKDESRGSRGSNANPGDWDVDFRVAKHDDHVKTVRIEKANDQDEGQVTAFKLKQVQIGFGEDMESITTSIVDTAEVTFEIQPTLGEREDALQSLKRTLHLLDLEEFTTEEMQLAWKCADSTVRKRVQRMKEDEELEQVAERKPGSKERIVYRLKV